MNGSYSPSISRDSPYVVFCSDASNLIFGDVIGFEDIFVRVSLKDFSWNMFLSAIIGKQ